MHRLVVIVACPGNPDFHEQEGSKDEMKRARNWILAIAAGGALACESTKVVDPLTLGQAIAIIREVR